MANRKSISALEELVRQNVKALLAEHYGGKPGRIASKNKGSITLSVIQEFVKGTTGCTLAMVQRYAAALHVKPYQLLIPNLDPADPAEAIPTKELRRLQKIRRELLEEETEK